MICPSCNQPANTFFRFVFTREGVSLAQGIKGYLRCQHCGALLRIARFRNQVWYFVAALTIAFFIFFLVFVKPLIGEGDVLNCPRMSYFPDVDIVASKSKLAFTFRAPISCQAVRATPMARRRLR